MANGFKPLTANQYEVVNHTSQATTTTYEPAKQKQKAPKGQFDPS